MEWENTRLPYKADYGHVKCLKYFCLIEILMFLYKDSKNILCIKFNLFNISLLLDSCVIKWEENSNSHFFIFS